MHKLKNNHFKDEQTTQIVSWGHWFTLFNIFLVIILGSQYLLIIDWPDLFMGRFYAILSGIGHFSFLCFFVYLVFLFPMSFFIRSLRWQRIIAIVVATLGISILCIDIEVFTYFRMHLNFSIWSILTSSDAGFLNKIFIIMPFVLLFEILLAQWSWKKLRSLTKRKSYAKPVATLLTVCFVMSHLTHIWADANFYRPITMQRSSLPLSYPLTARHLLARYGFIDEQQYNARLKEEGNPSAAPIEYPLGEINYDKPKTPYNVLMVVIDGWNQALLNSNMPFLNQFANENIQFINHYAASNQSYLSDFSIFYGLDPNYYDSILAGHKPSALLDVVTRQRYSLGLFSNDNFSGSLYHRALFSNFSLADTQDSLKNLSNQQVTEYWSKWYAEQSSLTNHASLFSIVKYSLVDNNAQIGISELNDRAKNLDSDLASIITRLKRSESYNNTIVIITGTNGLNIDENNKKVSYSSKNNFDRTTLKVPLIIVWPHKKPIQISDITTHKDIMSTLMQEGLKVTSPLSQYSQGINLLELNESGPPREWIVTGNENDVAAFYQDKTVVIDQLGRAKIYDLNNQLLKDQSLDLPLFLQIVTNNRRFMIMKD